METDKIKTYLRVRECAQNKCVNKNNEALNIVKTHSHKTKRQSKLRLAIRKYTNRNK